MMSSRFKQKNEAFDMQMGMWRRSWILGSKHGGAGRGGSSTGDPLTMERWAKKIKI